MTEGHTSFIVSVCEANLLRPQIQYEGEDKTDGYHHVSLYSTIIYDTPFNAFG